MFDSPRFHDSQTTSKKQKQRRNTCQGFLQNNGATIFNFLLDIGETVIYTSPHRNKKKSLPHHLLDSLHDRSREEMERIIIIYDREIKEEGKDALIALLTAV